MPGCGRPSKSWGFRLLPTGLSRFPHFFAGTPLQEPFRAFKFAFPLWNGLTGTKAAETPSGFRFLESRRERGEGGTAFAAGSFLRPMPGSCDPDRREGVRASGHGVRGVLLPRKLLRPATRRDGLPWRQDSGNTEFRTETNTISKPRSYGEFDPGSERTLMACLIHASRARSNTSGERVSNA